MIMWLQCMRYKGSGIASDNGEDGGLTGAELSLSKHSTRLPRLYIRVIGKSLELRVDFVSEDARPIDVGVRMTKFVPHHRVSPGLLRKSATHLKFWTHRRWVLLRTMLPGRTR